jgi:hypothetical protein
MAACTPDTRMHPRDINISGAEAKVGGKLHEYKLYNRTPREFQAHSCLFEAECSHGRWSQMDVPILYRVIQPFALVALQTHLVVNVTS